MVFLLLGKVTKICIEGHQSFDSEYMHCHFVLESAALSQGVSVLGYNLVLLCGMLKLPLKQCFLIHLGR